MPETDSSIFRFIARVKAIFEVDWAGQAGERWRRTIGAMSRFNRAHLQLDDKAKAAPGLAWGAVEGLATEKRAKAAADYSKAENDRIDAALKRRVMEDKARQERATANKLEAEAVQARIQEIKARVALARECEGLGVAIVIDSDGTIRVCSATGQRSDIVKSLLNIDETRLLESALVDVRIPEMGQILEGRLTRWLRKRGDRVESDEPILELETTMVDTDIPSPTGGIVFELLVGEGTMVRINETIVARIDPSPSNRST
jgi:biotin carboxyl carrier protein